MKLKKNMLLAVVGCIAAALIGMVGFILFKGVSQLNKTKEKLEHSKTVLNGFYRKDPFPSEENVVQEKENVQILNNWFSELMRSLREGQIESEEKSPSVFMGFIGDKKNKLLELGRMGGTVLPENFAFGFDRYFAENSALPAPGDVPRLTQQLIIVEKLCKVFFEERTKEISRVVREEFEDATGPSDYRRKSRHRSSQRHEPPTVQNKNTGIIGEDSLYAKQHLIFEFKAKENTVLNILNRLANHEMFIVVSLLQFEKEKPDVFPPQSRVEDKPEGSFGQNSDEKSPERSKDVPSRRDRMVCGKELEWPMRVKLELDVYTFREE